MRINRLFPFLGVVFLTLLVSFSALAQEGYRVQRLKIRGNKAFYKYRLKTVVNYSGSDIFQRWIMRKEPDLFYSETLAENLAALKRFYQKEGYLNFKLDSAVLVPNDKRSKVKIILYLKEEKPYKFGDRSISVNANMTLNDFFKGHDLNAKILELQSQKGSRFVDAAVYGDERMINSWFSDVGYPYSIVSKEIILHPDSLTTSIVWRIKTGPKSRFGKVTIAGNEHISAEVIAKNITLKEGELYSKHSAENTQKSLVDLGVFNVVSITPVLSASQSDTIPILINVREAPRFTTKFGLGYGKEEHVRAFVKVSQIGVLGGARRGEFYAKISYLEPYNISYRFTQPGFVYPLTSLVLYPYIAKNYERGYKLSKYGGAIMVQKTITKDISSSFGYNYEGVRLDTTSVADIPLDALLSSRYTKAGFNLSAAFDNTQPKFDPSDGYVIMGNAKLNGLLLHQKYPFFKLNFGIKKFSIVYRNWVLASKLEVGSIYLLDGGQTVPVEERFFAGGGGSVRGWARHDLGPKDVFGVPTGGKSMLEGSIEMRIPLIGPVRGVAFFDGGNVWVDSYHLSFAELRYSAGGGIRVASPIGPIGFDVARPVFRKDNTWQFMINIGPTF